MKNVIAIILLTICATAHAAFVNMASEAFVTNKVDIARSTLSNYVDRAVASARLSASNQVSTLSNYVDRVVSSSGTASTDFVTNQVATLSNYVDRVVSGSSSGPRKTVAMFIIPVNDIPGTNGPYCCVELKCSTNNYAETLFYTATAWLQDHNGDGSTLLLLNRNGQYDKRKYWKVPDDMSEINKASLVQESKSIVILVSPSSTRRSDGEWLYEHNEDAAWIWARATIGSREGNPDGTVLWRPISPVRWFSKMPTWSE